MVKYVSDAKTDSAGLVMAPYYNGYVPIFAWIKSPNESAQRKITIQNNPKQNQYFVCCESLKSATIGYGIIYIKI